MSGKKSGEIMQDHAAKTPVAPLKEPNKSRLADLQGIRNTPLVPRGHGGGPNP